MTLQTNRMFPSSAVNQVWENYSPTLTQIVYPDIDTVATDSVLVSEDDLDLGQIWGCGPVPETNTVDSVTVYLRAKASGIAILTLELVLSKVYGPEDVELTEESAWYSFTVDGPILNKDVSPAEVIINLVEIQTGVVVTIESLYIEMIAEPYAQQFNFYRHGGKETPGERWAYLWRNNAGKFRG